MEYLKIDRIIKVTPTGATNPIIIKAQNNKNYLLKTRYDGIFSDKKDYSIFMEVFSYKLLEYFEFKNIPQIDYLIIDDEFIDDASFSLGDNERDKQALTNIKNSKGVNLGVKWIENSEKSTNYSNNLIEHTCNYDGYLMNSDREQDNPNILYSATLNKNFLIDFGNAFETLFVFDDIISKESLFKIPVYYNKFCFDNRYLFYDKISDIKKYRKKVNKDILENIINEIPEEWQPHKYKDEIIDIIYHRIGNKRIFDEKTL